MKKRLIVVNLILIIFSIFLGFIGFQLSNQTKLNNIEPKTIEPISFVTISINPEVELALDENNKILEVIPINDDADVLLSDLNLVGLNVEESIEKIVDSAMEIGFLEEYSEENAVIVTAVSDGEKERKELEETVINKINTHFETKKIYSVVVAKGLNDELKAEAASYNISNGKMLLIQRALSLDETLIKEELVNNSIQQIQKLIKSYVKKRHDTLKETKTNLKKEWINQKNTLKQEYLDKVEQLKSTIMEEHSEEFENMTPAEKEAAIQVYLDVEKEIIKSTINDIKNEIKTEIKENKENYPIIKNDLESIKKNIKDRIQKNKNKK